MVSILLTGKCWRKFWDISERCGWLLPIIYGLQIQPGRMWPSAIHLYVFSQFLTSSFSPPPPIIWSFITYSKPLFSTLTLTPLHIWFASHFRENIGSKQRNHGLIWLSLNANQLPHEQVHPSECSSDYSQSPFHSGRYWLLGSPFSCTASPQSFHLHTAEVFGFHSSNYAWRGENYSLFLLHKMRL